MGFDPDYKHPDTIPYEDNDSELLRYWKRKIWLKEERMIQARETARLRKRALHCVKTAVPNSIEVCRPLLVAYLAAWKEDRSKDYFSAWSLRDFQAYPDGFFGWR